MTSSLTLLPAPELVIGLVAPIGVDLDIVTSALSKSLVEMQYQTHEFRITRLMREINIGKSVATNPFIQSYKDRIAYANHVRREFGDEALAALAITAIRAFRRTTNLERHGASVTDDQKDAYAPLTGHAYIIRQFKRPEEITLLRRVYGRQFILISAYAAPDFRKKALAEQERRSTRSRRSKVDCENLANELVALDTREVLDSHGQNVRDAFPLADVIVDATAESDCERDIHRFIHLLFGSNKMTPTHEEYGMYIAKSASLRAADLSRQVGAAIFTDAGEIVSMGSNEVPKAGGGTYWTGDPKDARDYTYGYDPNDNRQRDILVDLVSRLSGGKHLSSELMAITDPTEVASLLLERRGEQSVTNSMLMDLLEFGRIVHPEMSALSDAARLGISVKNSTLYCTTFPCHMCAKHIVASGISRVVYLEPYQKSYAQDLHADAISVDTDEEGKVSFKTFVGISPFRYRDLFERRRKRKSDDGEFQEWSEGSPRPNIELFDPGYRDAEERVAAAFSVQLESFKTSKAPAEQLELVEVRKEE